MPKRSPTTPNVLPAELIQRQIYVIRGRRAMLDVDISRIYGVQTRVLIQAVKRNSERFPEDFMFQLSKEEAEAMRSQTVIASRRNIRYRPYVFTEHGALMLASILRSPQAVQMSIFVVRAFIQLREYLATHKDLARKIEELERRQEEHGQQLASVYSVVKQLIEAPAIPRKRIGFTGRMKGSVQQIS